MKISSILLKKIFLVLIFYVTRTNTQFPSYDDMKTTTMNNITKTTSQSANSNSSSGSTNATTNTNNSNNSTSTTASATSTTIASLTVPSKCGPTSPISNNDCTSVSSTSNSCCFYSIAGNTGCVYYGSKYSGIVGKFGLTLTCSSSIENMNKIIIFILLIVFIL